MVAGVRRIESAWLTINEVPISNIFLLEEVLVMAIFFYYAIKVLLCVEGKFFWTNITSIDVGNQERISTAHLLLFLDGMK